MARARPLPRPRFVKGKTANRLYKLWRRHPLKHTTTEAIVSADSEVAARLVLAESSKDFTWTSMDDVYVEIISRESLVHKCVLVLK